MMRIFSPLMLCNVVALSTALEMSKVSMDMEASAKAKTTMEASMEMETSAMTKTGMEASTAMETSAMAKVEMQAMKEAKALLQKEWAEPLPVVLKRAQKDSKTMHVSEALKIVGPKMSPEITGLLQGRNMTQGAKSLTATKSSGSSDMMKTDVFDRAMGFINAEIKIVRQELDLKLLECGFFKIQKESLLFETQDKLDEIAMDIGLAEAVINACQAEIRKQTLFVEERTAVLHKLEKECQDTHDMLAEVKKAAEEDLRVVNLILDTAKEECDAAKAAGFLQVSACLNNKGRTFFKTDNAFLQKQTSKLKTTSSQQAMQRTLFALFGMEHPLPGKLDLKAFDNVDDDYDETDDFPDGLMLQQEQDGQSLVQTGLHTQEVTKEGPPVGAANKASNDAVRERCSNVGVKPRCEKILDQLSQMQGEMIDALDAATKELNEWDEWCEAEIEGINTEINNAKEIIAARTEQFDKASAFHNGMLIEHAKELAFKLALCKELREVFKQCYDWLKDKEREMCGLMKIRQSVYNKVKNPDKSKPELLIEDCWMTAWVVGPCSETCLGPNGQGVQIISRHPMGDWDPTSDEGKYGSSCPPAQVDRDCATVQCPIDCTMNVWSEWSECSAECGGGSQSKTRGIKQPAEHGGAPCPATVETDACNTDSCDADCVLADWSPWTPCSRSCRVKGFPTSAGHQFRTKGIAEPVKGAGTCPKPHSIPDRFETQTCNDFNCPANIQCVADMDVVVVQDGSGSLWHWPGPRSSWDLNFRRCKDFTKELIEKSDIAEEDGDGVLSSGARWGYVVYSFNAVTKSQVTTDKSAVLSGIDGTAWPMGGTYTHRALYKAQDLLKMTVGPKTRLKVILLITDGRATNRAMAQQAATAVKNSGTRLMVIPIKGALRNKAEMCATASTPCEWNMVNTPKFTDLAKNMLIYLTNLCPTVVDPDDPAIGS